MSIQSEQFARNGLKRLFLVAGSGVLAIASLALVTYGYLNWKSFRQDRAQWLSLQATAEAEDFQGCRERGMGVSPQSRYFDDAQSLLQRCGLGLAEQQSGNGDLAAAIATALTVSPQNKELHGQAQALVDQWSGKILDQGEQFFQSGQLDKAVSTLRTLPEQAPDSSTFESTIEKWQQSWELSEAAWNESEALLQRGQWLAAKNQLEDIAEIDYWQKKKEPLLEQAEAGIAEVVRYEAEIAAQQERAAAVAAAAAAAASSERNRSVAAPGGVAVAPPPPPPAQPSQQATAYVPPPVPAPSYGSFEREVEQLSRSYVAEGQSGWDAWIQACQTLGGYVVDQGPDASCQP